MVTAQCVGTLHSYRVSWWGVHWTIIPHVNLPGDGGGNQRGTSINLSLVGAGHARDGDRRSHKRSGFFAGMARSYVMTNR